MILQAKISEVLISHKWRCSSTYHSKQQWIGNVLGEVTIDTRWYYHELNVCEIFVSHKCRFCFSWSLGLFKVNDYGPQGKELVFLGHFIMWWGHLPAWNKIVTCEWAHSLPQRLTLFTTSHTKMMNASIIMTFLIHSYLQATRLKSLSNCIQHFCPWAAWTLHRPSDCIT